MSRQWMPLYVADYLRDTRRLTAAEHGAYLLLIMEYWTAGKLPDDDKQLARIASMSAVEWKRARPNIEGFFLAGWKGHKRLDKEIAKSTDISNKRAAAAKLKHSNCSANADANSDQKDTHAGADSPSPRKISEAIASDAGASVDHRRRLFDEGLPKLARLTGKGPDACRSFVGKCLKAASDDAVTVLGLIEEAERNQVVDPSAWIAARLKPAEFANGKAKSGIIQAADDLCRKIASFDGPAGGDFELREPASPPPPRLLSSR